MGKDSSLVEPMLEEGKEEHIQSTYFKRDYSELKPEEYQRAKTREQVKVYLITYIGYALIHF